jgi:competence protein CoiA
MQWALINNERVKATPKSKGICPLCKQEVISKCGEIKVWHWSHTSNKDCDNWWEHETDWHINWKNKFPKVNQEVIIGRHRADIKINNVIIELQNSSISSEEIEERENFYKNMVWLLNGYNLVQGLKIRQKKNNNIYTFRWKNPPKSWWYANKPIYIDLNIIPIEHLESNNIFNLTDIQREYWKEFIGKVFLIKKIYSNIPCGGWGELLTKEEFLNRFK